MTTLRFLPVAAMLFLLFYSAPTLAQTSRLQFDHLQRIKGLDTRSITSIVQDHQGFMWFGTQDGLLRFDGYELKAFKNDLHDNSSLSDNNVRALAQDAAGNLWIGTQGGGLNKLDIRQEKFTRYTHNPDNPRSIGGNAVWSLLVDKSGKIWAGTWSNGISVLDPSSGHFTHIQEHTPDPVVAMAQDKSGIVWFGSHGLNSVDPVSQLRTKYTLKTSDRTAGSPGVIRAIKEDHTGKIWVTVDNIGVCTFDRVTRQLVKFNAAALPSGFSMSFSIHEDLSHTLWIGSNAGLALLGKSREQVSLYTHDPADAKSLSNDKVRVIVQSSDGSTWIGNEGGGINKSLTRKNFTLYQHDPLVKGTLSHNLIRALYQDSKDRIWVGTQGGGLNLFDAVTQSFRHISLGEATASSLEISSVVEDNHGTFWIGTWGGGLLHVNFQTSKVKIYRNNGTANSLSDDRIQIVYPDRSGFLWVGTENGLSKFYPEKDSWVRFGDKTDSRTYLLGSGVQGKAFVEDDDGTLWIGTWMGLNKVSPDRNTIQHFRSDSSSVGSLSSDHVISLHRDKKGNLWIGTFGGGLNQLVLASGKVVHYTESEGLANNTVYGILEDDNGDLWLSTNNGLSRFNPQTKTFKNYGVSDGLQSNEFYWGASLRLHDGTFLFGGVNGLNSFKPKEILDNKHTPPVVITDFRIFNKAVPIAANSILQESIGFQQALVLNYDQNILSFSFAALNYQLPENNQHAYTLENFDQGWNHVQDNRTATYTNLSPGSYTFRVKGSNNDGLWNEKGASVRITILPPYWKTWWFYTLSAIAVCIFIYGLVWLRERKIREDKRTVQRELEASLAEANDALALQRQAVAQEQRSNHDRNWIDQALASFGEILIRQKNQAEVLCHDILSSLTKHTGVVAGAIYLYNAKRDQLINTAKYGLDHALPPVSPGVGLVGMCYQTQEMEQVSNLPQDFWRITSGLGSSLPQMLLVVPLKSNEVCVGVMELALFSEIPVYQLKFIVQLSDRLTATIHTTLISQQTLQLLNETQIQTEELKMREEELRQNLEEMQSIQEDATRKKNALEVEIAQLRTQLSSYSP